MLALVMATMGGKRETAAWAIGGGIAFGAVLRLARPAFAWLGTRWDRSEDDRRATLATVLVLLMLSAWFTDMIGLYAVFGAFLLGMSIPRGAFAEQLHATIEPLTTKLLVPLFFI
jgi:Kef-type K+ transport system membrane component KefB